MTKDTKIVICGTSCITSKGDSLRSWIEALTRKEEMPPMIDPAIFEEDIDSIQKGPYEMHRVQKISALALLKGIEDAGIKLSESNSQRISVLFGNTYGVEEFKSGFYQVFSTSTPDLTSPSLFPYTTVNSISANLSVLFGIEGTNITFSSGVTSASEAILIACDLLSSGKSDTVIVIGESFFHDSFDKEFYRCGFRNECCASLVIKKESDVVASGGKIYARIEKSSHGFLRKDHCSDNMFDENVDREIVNCGISFGSSGFDKREKTDTTGNLRTRISMDTLLGNTFSASGVLGIILGASLLNGEDLIGQGEKLRGLKKVSFLNKDSYGSFVKIIISGRNHEDDL